MSTDSAASLVEGIANRSTRGKSLWVLGWERFRRKKLAMASLIIICAFYLTGVVGPFVAPFSYSAQNLDNSEVPAWLLQPVCTVARAIDFSEARSRPAKREPLQEHILGTDRLGRDVLSRII